VLRWTREALGTGVPFVAGAYIEGLEGDVVSLYRRQMEVIAEAGGTPIIFQTVRAHPLGAREKVALYREVCRGFPEVLGFELSPAFAPNGEVFDEETVRGLIDIPELKGMKHSSLDRLTELRRLA
jgi:4-hydroxy-tetrahydrodipicolinate synthase